MADFSKIEELAKSHFGKAEFRSGEREAIEHLLAGGNAIAFHHGGKESRLLYLLPSMLLPGPAVALTPGTKQSKAQAEEQVPTEAIHASWQDLLQEEWRARTAALNPSILALDDVEQLPDAIRAQPQLRGSLVELIRACKGARVLGLSSYGSPQLPGQLSSLLGVTLEPFYVDFFKSNVMYEVIKVAGAERRKRMAVRIATELPRPGIYYCSSVKSAKELYQELRENEVETGMFHPQLRAPERAMALEDFCNHRLHALITVGFPGAVASRSARFCVHYDLPESLEEYYYQASSTGSTDKPSRCILLFERIDRSAVTSKAAAKDPLPADAVALYKSLQHLYAARQHAIALPAIADAAGVPAKKARVVATILKEAGFLSETKGGQITPLAPVDERSIVSAVSAFRGLKEHDRRQFQELVNYAESGICRQKVLMRFFGFEDVDACGLCDNCRKGTETKARASTRAKKGFPAAAAAARAAAGETSPGAPTAVKGPRGWSRGDLVAHEAWGEGEVKQVWGDKLRVHFPGLGEKIVKADFVKPA
jgi:ATP-dependent DNA helicase RecQ